MKVEKLLLSVAEVSEMLGVSRPTVYKLVYQGALPFKKIGHKIMVPRVAFYNFINSSEQQQND